MKRRVMDPVFKSLKANKQIFVYKTEKANGENFQISYCFKYQAWIVGSKNVSIMVKNMAELEKSYNYREIIKMVKEEEDLEKIDVDKEEKVEDDNAEEIKDEVSHQKKESKEE